MISRAQQILIKRAQREAGLDDSDYREAIFAATGCRSSKDPSMTDRAVDLVLAYFEAIHWRAVDAGALQRSCRPDAVFRQRGYWSGKNTRQETSRDRWNCSNISQEIGRLETALAEIGFGNGYCLSIRQKVTRGRTDDHSLYLYRAALKRTLAAKSHAACTGSQ